VLKSGRDTLNIELPVSEIELDSGIGGDRMIQELDEIPRWRSTHWKSFQHDSRNPNRTHPATTRWQQDELGPLAALSILH